MNVKNLKKIAYIYFPELMEKFKAKELFNKIDIMFNDLVMAKKQEDFLKIAKNVHTLNKEECIRKYYPNAIRELNNLVSLGEAIIFNPKEYALLLDKELNILFEQISTIKNIKEQNNLRELFVLNSFNCACVSLFATLLPDLTEEEKVEQYLIQQTRLNIVLQNDIKKENEANYWYSLHWFIKGNKNNAAFYLKKMINQKTKMAILTEEENMLWIKNKLPKDFLSFVIEQYHNLSKKNI